MIKFLNKTSVKNQKIRLDKVKNHQQKIILDKINMNEFLLYGRMMILDIQEIFVIEVLYQNHQITILDC